MHTRLGDCDMIGCPHCATEKAYLEITRDLKEPPSVELPRASWEQTWIAVAKQIARRSYDPRLQVGAIIVTGDNTQVLGVGYNGNYKGGPHVHESSEQGKSGFLHAEANALIKADYNTHKEKHMYVTHSPCRDCSKLIINSNISCVFYEIEYRDTSGLELLRSVGIKVKQV